MATTYRRSPLALAVLGLLETEPMHPYAIQQRIKQWGKDQVVNVGQRAALYKTINRLRDAGLVTVRETERDQQYPERTVYEITDEGRAICRTWMAEMLATPRNEFPEFPAAISFLPLLTPQEVLSLLDQRRSQLSSSLAAMQAAATAQAGYGLPRVVTLEDEYLRAVIETELRWVESVVDDLRSGRLTWSREQLNAFDEGFVGPPGS